MRLRLPCPAAASSTAPAATVSAPAEPAAVFVFSTPYSLATGRLRCCRCCLLLGCSSAGGLASPARHTVKASVSADSLGADVAFELCAEPHV